jgi:hypothetical protein
MDRLHHSIELLQDVVVPEKKNGKSSAVEKLGSSDILVGRLGMLTAVEFDDQAMLHATEVGDERRDWVLTSKLRASALPSTQPLPEQTLGVGLIATEFPSVRRQPAHDSPSP